MKKVGVIGGKGNMGRRYALILEKYCDCEAVIFDIGSNAKIDCQIQCSDPLLILKNGFNTE